MINSSVKHHLTDAVMMAYSSGSLPEAFSLVVACHLSLCPQCQAAMAGYDALGGSVLEESPGIDMSEGALAATLALIEEPAPEPAPKTHVPSIFPAPLQDYVGGGLEKVRWRRIGGGIKQAVLPCESEATARLLYIPAGVAVQDHSHGGLEMTLVLQGAFSDEVDRFARGDVEFGDKDLEHTPIAEAGEDCICLAATDAPLKFSKFIPKLLQPFIGI